MCSIGVAGQQRGPSGAKPMQAQDARLQVRIAPGAMLRSSRIYIVRVGNFSNPLATPEANQWTLEAPRSP